MKELLSNILGKLINEKKGFKIIAWIFIVLVILAIVLYPIIDANFLYYSRTNKRIEDEYNSILNDMNNQSNNYISNIFQKETSKKRNIAKFLAGSWLFILVGIILPFTKDKNKGKRFTFNNFMASIFCLAIAGLLGFGCVKIPNIINYGINIVLYIIISLFLAYTISTSGKKIQ